MKHNWVGGLVVSPRLKNTTHCVIGDDIPNLLQGFETTN